MCNPKQMLLSSDPFKERQCKTPTVWSVALEVKGLVTVQVSLMSSSVRFAAINTSEKHPGVLTLAVKSISEPLNSNRKVLFCGDIAVIFMQVTSQVSPWMSQDISKRCDVKADHGIKPKKVNWSTQKKSGCVSGSQERLSRNSEIQDSNISLYFLHNRN